MVLPKGKILIIGGHEDKGEVVGENLTILKKQKNQTHFEILGSLIQKIPRAHHIIEIIAAASAIPEEMEALYINAYKKEGFTQVGFIKVANAKDACNIDSIQRIKNCHAVFLTGGKQDKLIALLAGSDILTAIKKKYMADKNFIVGGTSAGAMAIPEISITSGVIAEALYKNDIELASGLNLIKGIIVDTHFIKRGRFARLAHAVMYHRECIGIGLGENTALVISEGHQATCIGSGMVIIIDGKKMKACNMDDVDTKTPIVVSNLVVSILAEGSTYLIRN